MPFAEQMVSDDCPTPIPASVRISPLLIVALKINPALEEIEYGAVPPESRTLTPCPTDSTCVRVSAEPEFCRARRATHTIYRHIDRATLAGA